MASLKKQVVSSLVDHFLLQMTNDPSRALRRLVDLGTVFFQGAEQQPFWTLLQESLSREDSPYYILLRRRLAQVDRRSLRTVGVNMGWGTFVHGARILRGWMSAHPSAPPWALALELGEGEAALTSGQRRRILTEGQSLGICSYLLIADDSTGFQEALRLADWAPECALFLLLDRVLRPEDAKALASRPHLTVLLDGSSPQLEASARCLRQRRCLYGAYHRCGGQEDADAILSGSFARRAVEAGCAFALSWASDQGGPWIQELGRYAGEMRAQQHIPLIFLDLYQDFQTIGDALLPACRYCKAARDGALFLWDGQRLAGTPWNLSSMGLGQALAAAGP